jgi:hypothetical protein
MLRLKTELDIQENYQNDLQTLNNQNDQKFNWPIALLLSLSG